MRPPKKAQPQAYSLINRLKLTQSHILTQSLLRAHSKAQSILDKGTRLEKESVMSMSIHDT